MKFFTVILYDRDGCEIADYPDVEGMAKAKTRAKHLLSEEWARANETTHERLRTEKVAIFAEGARRGAHALCEWDKFLTR